MEKRSIEIKWGVIFILAMLLWMFLERMMGLHDERIDKHSAVSGFFAVVAIGIYLLALYDKRKNYYHGSMSWKKGFTSGLFITLTAIILTPLAQFAISQFISPDFFPNIIRYSVETGEMTRKQAQEHYDLFNYILYSIIFAAISGILTAAVTALVMRKRKNSYPL